MGSKKGQSRVRSVNDTIMLKPKEVAIEFSVRPWNDLRQYLRTVQPSFLPRSMCLLISWLQSPCAVIWEPKKIKSVTVSTFPPSICHEVMGLDAMILVFWMLSFKPAFSLSSLTFIKRLFSSSLLSIVRVISFAYLRLLIFLLAILILACESSSPAFHMMYSAYELNKQGDNTQPGSTLFQFWTSLLFYVWF